MRTKRYLLRRSAALAEQRPRDDEPLDLLGSLVELGDLRVAHHPLDRELVDVAVAPQHLDGVGGDPHRGVPGHEFTHRRPAAGVGRAGLDLDAGLVQELAGGLGRGVHVGEHRADHLEVADPLAELLALPRVGGRDLEGALGDPDGLGGDPRAAAIERAHREIEARRPRSPMQVGRRHADAVERELGGRAAADAHLVLDPGDREAGGRDLDDEARQPFVPAGVGVRDREDRDQVGHRAVADEPLRAGDDVVVAVADGAGADRGDVGARLGLGQGEGDEVLPGRQPRDPAGLLLGRAGRAGSAATPSSWTARISPVVAQARLICSIARQTRQQLRRRGRRVPRGTAGPGCPGRRGAGGGPRGTRRSCRSRRPAARPARRR